MFETRAKSKRMTAIAHTLLIDPFDIMLHGTSEGLQSLQNRFSLWLRGLTGPARFVTWQLPADLSPRISQVVSLALQSEKPQRQALLMEYRRHYERLQSEAEYQRAICGLAFWTERGINARALSRSVSAALDAVAVPAQWPALFAGEYQLTAPNRSYPNWHLAPVGEGHNRPFYALLSSYQFQPTIWDFGRPLAQLLRTNFPLALSVDIARTWTHNEAINEIENVVQAYSVHLATLRGEDSRSLKKVNDCRQTLSELNLGDALHDVQIVIAVAAPDLSTLKQRVNHIVDAMKPWFLLRAEIGEAQAQAARFFAAQPTSEIAVPHTTWPITSRELALLFAPLGYRKLSGLDGTLRGEAAGANYPVFHNSWRDRRATHEVWVGVSGYGKTFALNCLLLRQWAEENVPFTLLEPMGHGAHLAQALDIPWYVMSAQHTCLNPQDVMFPTLVEQKAHTIRLYETLLGRQLSGTQKANQERALLGEALELLYSGFDDWRTITPEIAPLTETVCDVLSGLGDKEHLQRIARDLADEIAGLCTGRGPWAAFVNGATNMDLSARGKTQPQVFSFHEMEQDPVMLAIAYTQVLSAIRRDSLSDESPRIIAVDEVYRLMRHPSLLDFLIEAAKTFRTRRKKLIVVDQQMTVFLENKARLVFENCPIRVIFNQRQGLHVFRDDPAFQHFNTQHLEIIANLPRFHYLFDVQDEGIWYLYNRPSDGEYARFSNT
ncbi:MAG: hypothetical protein H6670_11075 [Anaerolineaceae bacterium]|nr:hypothetical protein [Anaerolineaceae bacterium]